MKRRQQKPAVEPGAVDCTIEALHAAFKSRDFQRADELLDLLRETWVDDGASGEDRAEHTDAKRPN